MKQSPYSSLSTSLTGTQGRKNFLVVLTMSVLFTGMLVAAFSTGAVGSPDPSAVPTPAPSMTQAGPSDTGVGRGFAHIVKAVRPAVVNITASKVMGTGLPDAPDLPSLPDWFKFDPRDKHSHGTPPFSNPWQEPRGKGMGSGVIVSPEGYVVTNHHVVDGAKTVTVALLDKREFTGSIVGSDPQTDLAVIKIQGDNLPFIAWGNSSKLEVGDYVLAIGSPFGLRSTVTQGIVSAKGRGVGITQYEDFIQTDAAINPGNSGGALVNMHGELVGINTAILSRTGGYQGVGLAIPASIGQHVYASLVSTGKVTRGFLGVGIQAVTPELAKSFHLDRPDGAIVTEVRDASPADQAGLRRGDTITGYQDQPIADPRELQRAVTTTTVGTKVTITVMRDGAKQTLRTTIVEHPMGHRVAASQQPDAGSRLAGLTVEDLTPRTAKQLGIDGHVAGVVVTDVRAGSQAEQAGLVQGDVIREINHTPVESSQDFRQAVNALSKEQTILLFINRQGTSLFLTVKV
ncbi:MAG: Do family serine endopeptidase [Nitrospira sp.]|nr:Do family serine endopeptidase [Nitrospira sp.]MDE0403812.1 Do family serine endopeptidase [Nitrospira sp.]MDE0487187.1 Do family serine endopeptidase [Nitrospira sp.]